MTAVIHAITPGDHYSPRTGSAIPTVVHGLADASSRDHRAPEYDHFVSLDRTTYRPRYDSARAIEFDGVPAPTQRERYTDLARGRLGLSRAAAARYFGPLAEAVAALPSSIVLAHNAPILPWLLRKSDHRVVLYAHNDILRSYDSRELSRTLETMAALVCVSESLAQVIRAQLPVALRKRVHVVGNGVDTQQFTPGSKRESGPVSVMFMGRMIRDKGPDVFLKAAELIPQSNVEFVLVGSHQFDRNSEPSAYERELRALAANSTNPVRFEPFVDRAALPALLREADVLVLPSRWPDPCPLTVGEGLATGLPVIASAMGGIPEILGPAGRQVPPDDPAALARAITELVADPALRRELGEADRARAEEHDWSWAWGTLRQVLDQL